MSNNLQATAHRNTNADHPITEFDEFIQLKKNRDTANPSESVQMSDVQQHGFAIRFITNPSEAVQIAAVQQTGYAIEYIANPSESVQMAAVQQDGWAIEYIVNPSSEVQFIAELCR